MSKTREEVMTENEQTALKNRLRERHGLPADLFDEVLRGERQRGAVADKLRAWLRSRPRRNAIKA